MHVGHTPSSLGVQLRLTNNLVTQAQTYVIRTGLSEEFPEYKKYLDGSYKQEEEEERKRKQEAPSSSLS